MFIATRLVSLTDAYLLKQLATSGASFEKTAAAQRGHQMSAQGCVRCCLRLRRLGRPCKIA
eukprot:180066-Pyramimonas_sp.AAC.1